MNANSQSRWKSAFLTLPDAAFFDILRNYLGDFKTPFNKQLLVESLEAFLRKPETRRRILTLVDRRDARLLTAVRLLESPTHEALHRFFEGEIGYLDLHYALLNLQDRLLIYSDRVSGSEEFLLNPLLADDFEAEVFDPGLLVPSVPAETVDPPEPWLGDALLTALLSFLLEERDLFKADGTLKKKAENALRDKFPELFGGGIARLSETEKERSRIMLLVAGLTTVKLLRAGDGGVEPDLDAWREFAGLDRTARLCLLIRGSREKEFPAAWREAEWLAAFLPILEGGRAYTIGALVRLGRLAAHNRPEKVTINEDWIESLIDFGLLLPSGGDTYALNPRLPSSSSHAEGARIIVQPNFDVTVKPGLTLEEGIPLAAAAEIRKLDRFPGYELTKASFSRALRLGFDGGTLAGRLRDLCGGELPQNVSFSFGVWEREYLSITMYEGVVIIADEDRRHLLDHHKEFRRRVKLHPSPGVYLVDRSDLPACGRIFKEAGIDLFPRLRKAEELRSVEAQDLPVLFDPDAFPSETPRGGILFPRAFSPPVLTPPSFPEGGKRPAAAEGRTRSPAETPLAIHEELLGRLGASGLPEDQAGEIRERIRRKLVIFPEQIRPETTRRERTEAKGLNYVGKVLVIEGALANSSDYLEIVLRAPDGSPTRLLARPKELRRTGTDLVLAAEKIPGGETVEIHVKKISLVRRLRGFLIG